MDISVYYSLHGINLIIREFINQDKPKSFIPTNAVKSIVLEEIQKDQEACWRLGLTLSVRLSPELIDFYFDNVVIIVQNQFNNNPQHDRGQFAIFMKKNSNWPLAYSLPMFDAIHFYIDNRQKQ